MDYNKLNGITPHERIVKMMIEIIIESMMRHLLQ